MAAKVIVVSASDTKFFGLLKDMLASLDMQAVGPNGEALVYDVGIFDLGLSAADLDWLDGRTERVVKPRPHMGFGSAESPLTLAYLVRPFLPEYFPGFDIYLWIDSDVWLQSPEAPQAMIAGAASKGMAIAHENEKAYKFQPWLFRWTAKHFVLGYGLYRGLWLLRQPHLNAGIFAAHRDAPHWQAWARRYQAAMERTGKITPHDQFALNQAIYQDKLPTEILPPGDNWICDRGVPMWNDAENCFCEPYAPYKRISAIHLAGPGKRTAYPIRRTGGAQFQTVIRYGAAPAAAAAI
jgi:hypothetical protein